MLYCLLKAGVVPASFAPLFTLYSKQVRFIAIEKEDEQEDSGTRLCWRVANAWIYCNAPDPGDLVV